MRHRSVGQLMTRPVVSVRPGTGFKEIARLLAEHDITAVPVLDAEDRPVGVVSEADLMLGQCAREDPSGMLLAPRLTSEQAARSRATTAGGLMSRPALCCRPEWTAVEAARRMQQAHLKRLPVVDEAGRLIGIVSRSDLLRVFLRQDRAIREEIRHDVLDRAMGLSPDGLGVTVEDGRVTLTGTVQRRSLVGVLERLCRSVDGVVDVTVRLDHREDDTAGPGAER
ncbi:CBS domain-containing protein [Kitasatospora cineracea]|uniref:BON domain-containing protein n=1 Tax=Kitasatospora cineracea TaxID=88074 RepID=A0A8G1UKK6_9ACTN|nr:CBS domain-containing protein [Kitasatospora cineracea]ROR45570.1 BON domain-containing protein [Kitasatospora cineracea]